MIQTVLIVLLVNAQLSLSASCGSSGIPFRLEVMPDGNPVLGCASPICFGTEAGGQNVMYDSQFNTGPNGVDGFFRKGDLDRPRNRYAEAPAQLADCPAGFPSRSCNGPDAWVGGINMNADNKLEVQCCKYDGLKFSTEVGRPVVQPGEVYSGGEVIRDGRQTGFDLICNIKQISESYGKSAFQLTVCRMACIPDPTEDANDVAIDEQADINRILDKVSDPTAESQPLSPLPRESISEPRPIPVSDQKVSVYETANQAQPIEHVQGTDTDQVVQIGESVVPVQSGGGYYYPVAGGVPACFSADTIVKTSSGEVAIKDLEIGDLTTFTEVLSFMHRLPDQNVSFVRIETADHNVVKLTPLHFIYKTDCQEGSYHDKLIYAEDLKMFDCVYTIMNGNPSEKVRIVDLAVVEETGIYAPMTTTGDLYVNNILASCYSVIRSNVLSHTFFMWLDSAQRTIQKLFNTEVLRSAVAELPTGARYAFNVINDILPK